MVDEPEIYIPTNEVAEYVRQRMLEESGVTAVLEESKRKTFEALTKQPDLSFQPVLGKERAPEMHYRYIGCMSAEKYLQAVLACERGNGQLLRQAYGDATELGGFVEPPASDQQYAEQIGSPLWVNGEALRQSPNSHDVGLVPAAWCEIRLPEDRRGAQTFIEMPDPHRDSFHHDGDKALQQLRAEPETVGRLEVIGADHRVRRAGYASMARLGTMRELRARNGERSFPVKLLTLNISAVVGMEEPGVGMQKGRKLLLSKAIWNFRSVEFFRRGQRCPARPLWLLRKPKPVTVYPANNPKNHPYPQRLLTQWLVMGIYLDECQLDE